MKMQHRYRTHVVRAAFLGLFAAAPARAASLTQVNDWGASGVPSYVKMYIYVPDKLAAKPPILVSAHACMSTASGQMGAIPKIKAAADANGFILILPDNPGRNCWDVGNTTSLKHDGGGDTQAIAQMVKYTLSKYNGDASRVYAMGGSSGAMLTQALMAVYPDVFRAGSARAGVPAGCWADGYDPSMQWSGTCAKGTVSKTAQQWGDLVRAMYTGYTGHRPRIQIIQGDADMTIDFKNSAESIKEWTNVLGLSATPSSTDMLKTSISTYTRQFWKNSCGYTVLEAWAGKGGGHSMGYEEDDILKFFGLDKAGGADPEPDCPPGGGTGTGGATGAGGAVGNGGAGPSGSGGTSSSAGGTGPAAAGSGGSPVVVGSGGVAGVSGAANTGIAGSTIASGGSPVSGTPSAAAGAGNGAAGSSVGSPAASAGSDDSGGCAFVPTAKSKYGFGVIALGLSLLALARRRRHAQS
ncbi:MAG TPA: PHB depolymerase family esterase [Polyangiaceae bacterium]|nr:PHB depolymerase family esterase [Polyangiaceae bacterium]